MNKGWIKLHRELMEKAIWLDSTPEQKTILMTLLMMANHKEKEWEWKGEKYKAESGQFVTSLDGIANKCGKGITTQNVRTALKRFEKYDFLTNQSTNRNRLITIVNWHVYQQEEDKANKQTNKQLTSNQQATNKQLTTNKNDKNNNNEKNSASRSKLKFETLHLNLAEDFFNEILKNNLEHKKPNLESWANDIRLMMERDGRTEEQIKYLMKWVQQDDFEMTNVLSPAKLRKRFDQLIMKVKQEKEKYNNNKVQPIRNYRPDSVEITEDDYY